MRKCFRAKRDPYYMYLGNLLIFENGHGTVSDINYVVIRERKHLFAKKKYYAFPGGQEVLVGPYEINADNCDMPLLVNAEHLHGGPHEIKVDASYVRDVILETNDINKLKALRF